ncbi:hypothetical protein RBB50_005487 [Rhinocladiella similis]
MSSESVVDPSGKHYFAFSGGAYRYLGAQAPLLDFDTPEDRLETPPPTTPDPIFPIRSDVDYEIITPELHRYLTGHFFDSVHQIYPILNPPLPCLSSNGAVDLRSSPNEAFLQQIVYAISCRSDQTHGLFSHPLATAAHSRALQYFERATAESSISTLQVAILLVLYTLFDPSSGNLSQQVGFAARLAIELTGSDPDEPSPTLSNLVKVIYCLENQACGVLVRPTSLQEPGAPLTFSVEDPLDFLCTLYRIQSRVRTGLLDDSFHATCGPLSRLTDDTLKCLHPNVLSTLRETQFVLHTTAPAAASLVAAYLDDRYIPTFLSAHWVFKAACVIVEAMPTATDALRPHLMQDYGYSTALLGKWSTRWDAARILLDCLQFKLKASVPPS